MTSPIHDLASFDWILVNSSAGKDSQTSLDVIAEAARAQGVEDRVVVVHCDLARAEWEGTRDLAEEQAALYGYRFEVVKRAQGDLVDQIRARGLWPGAKTRYCTSEHKRGQVFRLMTALAGESRERHGKAYRARILNILGIRAEEGGPSGRRAKEIAKMERGDGGAWRADKRASNSRREVVTFYPIADWTETEVWDRIKASGVPHHKAYDLGMSRLSCVFCVFASRNDLEIAGRNNAALLDEYVEMEEEMGHKFRKDLAIAEIRDTIRGDDPEPSNGTPAATETPNATPVVLSYGMGVDSTAILLRWIFDPSSRDFDLEDLVVLTSQTGSEFAETGDLVERFILPLLASRRIRFVEIARKAQSQKGGRYVVLQDTREPKRLHLGGAYKLIDELSAAGTVPQSSGGHLCSIKSKAVPLEAWIEDEFGASPRRHIMGYSAEETKRIRKDLYARAQNGTLDAAQLDSCRIVLGFSSEEEKRIAKANRIRGEEGQVVAEFPLAVWNWDREACLEFILEATGADWPKSCCTFCPFSGGRAEILARYAACPDEAVEPLVLEAVSLALNPRGLLYKTRALFDLIDDAAVRGAFEAELASTTWALYRTRRRFSERKDGKFNVARSVEIVATGARSEVRDLLEDAALRWDGKVEEDRAIARVVVQTFDEKHDGAQEEILAIAPARAEAKAPIFNEALWIANEPIEIRRIAA